MTPSKQPKYSFLIDSLNVSPDAFFDCIKARCAHNRFDNWGKLMEHSIRDLTEQRVKAQDLRHYNDEVVKSWGEFVAEQEWKLPESENKSIFNFIRNFAKECLHVQNGEAYFRVELLDDWQSVSFGCGEDLFVAALLADMNINYGYEPRDFQWDYILKSDFFLLNNLISQKKIVENHYHLGGSAPYVDLSWIYLMNNPFGQTSRWERFKDKSEESVYLESHSLRESHQSDIENLVKAAAYLRVKLFEFCVLGENNNALSQEVIGDIDRMLKGIGILQEDELQPKIEAYRYRSNCERFGTKVDYAIREFRVFEDEKNNYISGERYFNYQCLRFIFGHPKSSFVQVLYYLYLLIRHHFNKEFIQANNKTGFQNFKEYNDRKSELVRGTDYDRMAVNIAIQGNILENYLDQLEVRVKPENSPDELRGNINWGDSNAYYRSSRIKLLDRVFPYGVEEQSQRKYGDGTEDYFYVLHFIKNRNPTWFSKDGDRIDVETKYGKRKYSVVRQCREFEARERYRVQAETLKEMRDRNDEVCRRIFGIDAASNEVNFRPENFGTVFRFLSSSKIRQDVPWERKFPDLRKTYHVGEDFYDVVDGLRAIDEAILFLELSQGDRIGHGVALGIDVEKWYERHNTISLPKQNLLDNLAWIRYMMREYRIDVPAYYSDYLKSHFDKLYIELYEEPAPGLLAYMEAWKLRGDDPKCYSSTSPDKDNLMGFSAWDKACIRDKKLYREILKSQESIDKENLRDNSNKVNLVYKIYHRYHFDEELKRRASERVEFKYKKEYVEIVKKIQLQMRSYITEKGIAVESCPTSNFLISNLDSFDEIPTFNLFPLRESHNDFRRLNVCINTDDQGVFYTSLVKEYTRLMATMWKEIDENGMREHSDDKIMIWIKRLMDYSKQLCFRTGDVRYYGIRSDSPFSEVGIPPVNSQLVLPYTSN